MFVKEDSWCIFQSWKNYKLHRSARKGGCMQLTLKKIAQSVVWKNHHLQFKLHGKSIVSQINGTLAIFPYLSLFAALKPEKDRSRLGALARWLALCRQEGPAIDLASTPLIKGSSLNWWLRHYSFVIRVGERNQDHGEEGHYSPKEFKLYPLL